MTLRQLEYLVTVIDEGRSDAPRSRSTSRSRRSRARSARSRTDRRAAPRAPPTRRAATPTGEAILPAARAALAAAARARRSARMVLGLEAGELEIATVGAVALGLLPPVLRRWRTRHRARTVRLHEHRDGVALADAVAQGGPDLGIGPRPPEWTGPIEALGWEEFVVVLPPGDPLRDTKGPIDLARMARRDWVLFERDHGLGWIVEAICATAGFTPVGRRADGPDLRGARARRRGAAGRRFVPLNIVPGPAAPMDADGSTRPGHASCAPSPATPGAPWRARSSTSSPSGRGRAARRTRSPSR